MTSSFARYLRRALGFRPFGMLFPPHLAILAAFGMLGFVNPGFWLIGAGAWLAYLLSLVTLPRFRALVDRETEADEAELDAALARLGAGDRARFERLREDCERLAEAEHEADALGRVLQVHLALLGARAALRRVVAEADATVATRLAEVESRLALPEVADELRRSLEDQRAVLRLRAETQAEAARKLEHAETELSRVEDHVALLREQAALAAGAPVGAARRIDAVTGALAETRRWLDEEPELEGPARVPLPVVRARRAQSS